ncbi:hypothetical protein Q8W71_24795 [Methylobacterium sp. NEAU 140]|uniref:galactose-binding domain-containing protein n=1 Tax=Methylobacterium sp. NEAU 140 TaxID=3064945 RepID=UPI0027375AB8|nr:hypothetical protein [Methylobacterium sp. NEAU 140]MDP4025854.1 hypothetical protein [Methylobacterium sp. NEAU 140]
MIVDIRYDDAVRSASLTANSYEARRAAEREAMSLGLRHRFRAVRRVLVTFASGQRYVDRQRIFTASAAATGEFQTIESWTFDRVRATPFFSENRDILQRARGQGYWLWKPYIVSRALETSEDGDLIVYNDSLPEDGNVLGRSILPMLAWLSGGERRIAIARKPAQNRSWTKRDCFYHMGCDTPAYWEREQVIATYMAFIAGPETRRLVAEWLGYCRDSRILTDEPNTCGLDNFPDFQDHRHDQSVLSNLLIRDRFELPDILFGRDITTKHLQETLGVFEDTLLGSRAREAGSRSQEICVSLGKRWTQSSPSPWSPVEGMMTPDGGDKDFFFHTETEECPWWLLDLGEPHSVERIEIVNRPTAFGWRANRMQVYVGASPEDLRLTFDAVVANWDAATPLDLRLSGESVRFVKITVDNVVPLHLKDVRVFGRG